MEKHLKYLENICRTCGGKIKERKKLVLLYMKEINRLFGYDISIDDDNVCPRHICDSCRRFFDRAKLDLNKIVQGDLKIFLPHDSSCLCLKSSNRSSEKIKFKLVSDKTTLLLENVCMIATELSMNILKKEDTKCTLGCLQFSGDEPNIDLLLTISIDGCWKAYYRGKTIDAFVGFVNPLCNEADVKSLLVKFKSSKHCLGNSDFQMIIDDMLNGVDTKLHNKDGGIVTAETTGGDTIKDLCTFRSQKCLRLIDSSLTRCEHCQGIREKLRLRKLGIERRSQTSSKYTNISFLGKEGMKERLQIINKEKKELKRKVNNLEQLIQRVIEREGVDSLSSVSNASCAAILSSTENKFDEDTPMHLLWEQQKKALSVKSANGMRWHPLIIRWCMSIYLKSPGTYKHIRETGFIKLPDKSTLNKYCNFTERRSGFNPDVISLLLKDVNGYSDYQFNVGVLFDEMKIKKNLVYSKTNGKIVGFCELGDMNTELETFSNNLEKDETDHREAASYVLVLMVKGLFSSLSFPFGYFASTGLTGDQLFNIVWDGIGVLESIGFKVRFLCCDGASPNRRFYNMHLTGNNVGDGVVYWAFNRHAVLEKRKIYFISDVPHLMKTTRNNFSNSGAHSGSRNLMIDGMIVSWQHIIDLFACDRGMDRTAPGLYKTKLTTDHVYLNARSKMSVVLAVQVLSKSVHSALDLQDLPQTVKTRKLIFYMNKFFDCLNVRTKDCGRRKRNTDLYPYSSPDDDRLVWLKEDFLTFINDWRKEGDTFKHMKKSERAKFCLSQKTVDGLRMTVHSFVEMVPLLLKLDGVTYVLSDKLNQDSVEEHFSRQRMKGGANDNPTLEEFRHNELKLQICKTDLIRVRGNTKGRERDSTKIDVSAETSLPKKSKK